MDLTIYNHILYGDLKPWHCTDQERKFYRQNLRPQFQKPESNSQFYSALKELLNTKSNLFVDDGLDIYQTIVATDRNTELTGPLVKVDLKNPTSPLERFYHYLIFNETTRISNRIYNTYTRDISDISKKGIVQDAVKSVKDLLLKIGTDKGNLPTDDLTTYVIDQLIANLVRLLKEVEYLFPDDLFSIASTKEEIFGELLQMEIPENDIAETTALFSTVKGTLLGVDSFKLDKDSRVSFGFKGNGENLKAVLYGLQKEIELLNIDKTTVDQLYTVLTSKDLTIGAPQVYINCQSNLFNHTWRKLKSEFTNLGAKSIADTNLFHTLNGKPFTKTNLDKKVNEYSNSLIEAINRITKQL
jgi:hypothetical protein